MKLSFEEYVKEMVEHKVKKYSILHIINANDFMVQYGIESSLGFIYINRRGAVTRNNGEETHISQEYIRENFNKKEYVKAILNSVGVFKYDYNSFYEMYMEQLDGEQ